jgi:phenylalanyl-tRNA synthetase beta subunit
MNIYKDLSFISNNQKYLFQTIEKAKFLDFVIDIKSLDKFIKPDESIAYTFRFFFDNSKTYTNDQINSMMNKVIQIFEDDGFKLNSK